MKITLLLWSRIYFKRIYITGAKHVPQDRPVFLASNHANGFLDGVMVSALLLRKPTYIFVRGDVFKKKWANFLLRSLKLIPIFRARDGEARENLANNNRSFDQVYEKFKKDKVVLIFPEADAQLEKHLRPLKKGMSRIIADMQSRENGDMEVAIVPFGLNYTHFKHHRNEMMLSFQAPVYLKDYEEEGGNQRAALNRLTKDVESKIRSEMVDINKGDEEVTETALRIVRQERSESIFRFWIRSRARLAAEQKATELVKQSSEDSELRAQLKTYQNSLDELGAKEVGTKPVKLWQWLFLLVFIIPSSISWLVMRWGLHFGKKLVDKRVKKDELYESVYFGLGLFHNWLLVLIGYPVVGILWGWKGLLAWFVFRWLSIPYQQCMDIWSQAVNNRKWKAASNETRLLREALVKQVV
ncbi:MAG: 1-acyl-sn-glycerol-3-phosphate acyltransferase [Bacteroidia bacterium]|nr:1-acyl-sn-glycerol-3-phosphate acyltransferase [Bacteroidia bacterium]